MIPRRISRVPPRKVHEGACKAVSASTSSNRSSVAWRRPGRARGSRARRHCRDAGQKRQTLRLGAIAQQQGSALPVGDPMRPDRSAGSQQFLGHDVAFEHAALPAAVAPGPGHPDPATRPQPPAERRRPMTAEIAVWRPQPRSKLLGDKLASLGPQGLASRRRVETEGGIHRPLCQRYPKGLLHSRWFTHREKHRPHHSNVVGMADEPPY